MTPAIVKIRTHSMARPAATGVRIGLLALVSALALLPAAAFATGLTPMPGMTYESLKDLPDFSGWWSSQLNAPRSVPRPAAPPPPLKPEVAARAKEIRQKMAAGVDPADLVGERPLKYCGPPVFVGSNGGLDDYFEILFTPGRVTIASELGLVRRIKLDDRPLPAEIDESDSGTSVGHWEGQTLVVETGGIKHDYRLNSLGAGSLGRNVRIVERISLREPDVLQIVTRTTAPDVYTAPYETTSLYRRDRTHVFQEVSLCVDHDRTVDKATSRERFDMTPPADLPPPPSK